MKDLKNKPVGAKPGVYYRNEHGYLITEEEQLGITLREHYAGLAMLGQLSAPSLKDPSCAGIAEWSVVYADALIAELEKTDQ